MSPLIALAFLGGLLLVSVLIILLLRARNGRVSRPASDDRIEPGVLGVSVLGERATIVQFSTEVCARCPGTRRVLSALVDTREDVDFVHVDVTHQPVLASRFNLLQTPTVLLLDARGNATARLSGVIARDTVVTELDAILEGSHARG
ncbi:thioredoxin [Mycetocola tolaasinivorans]|uniref:Thioredoxin n=1 Tax=Mycetocola tolaasinivorans TaxID=76635 RepID=A0A3L7AD39_9MICO|nr:thioredoxin family protein [Mycetocola tolaasinivorans]RLP77894.1 thioredoxin [Mycetocola tolaasinivorans]